ncbi:hypothetical protein [Bacillus seohaeanensis]|uniref:Uncharacterized protein n=1 Tax=Bacillus seohaeanensis TaxID=284580 RepID=A0ABW5RTN4_9BACI
MIADLFGSVLQGIPSKKNSLIKKKINLLSQEEWYKAFVNRYGNLIVFNNAFRNFIYQKDIETILKDKEKLEAFQEQLRQLVIKENL